MTNKQDKTPWFQNVLAQIQRTRKQDYKIIQD